MTERQSSAQKPMLTLEFDEIVEFTLKAQVNAGMAAGTAKPRPANAPDVCLKMDEVTAFTGKAIGHICPGQSEGAAPVQERPLPPADQS